MVVFFLVFVVIGGAGFFYLFLVPMSRLVAAAGWQQTPCTVVSSEVVTHADEDGSTYSVKIVYTYEFNGVKYESDRYDFAVGSTGGRAGKQAVVERYPPGTNAVCFVNPADPAQAIFNRSFTPTMLFGLFPLIFIAAGLGGMVAFLRANRGTKTVDEISAAASAEWLPEPAVDRIRDDRFGNFGMSTDASGPVTLRAKQSPIVGFIVSLVVTAFWNGIVSIFVWTAIDAFRAGNPSWFMTVILIPFVLVGLLLIFWVGHSFLSIFNPRPTVTLSSAAIPLGSTVDLSWTFTGNTGSIRRLRIFLKGQEEANYQRGTSNYTNRETFAELTAVDSTNFIDIASGNAKFTLPDDTMHSFEATHNKIIWTLELAGEIAFWPDVKVGYQVVVLPQPVDRSRRR